MALAAPLAAFVLGFSGVAKLRNQRNDVLRLRMGDLSIVGHNHPAHFSVGVVLPFGSAHPPVVEDSKRIASSWSNEEESRKCAFRASLAAECSASSCECE